MFYNIQPKINGTKLRKKAQHMTHISVRFSNETSPHSIIQFAYLFHSCVFVSVLFVVVFDDDDVVVFLWWYNFICKSVPFCHITTQTHRFLLKNLCICMAFGVLRLFLLCIKGLKFFFYFLHFIDYNIWI